jgi:hypothetical protein
MVKAETLEPEAIVAALKAGRSYASQGPEIHALEVRGREVAVACSPARAIYLLGRGSGATRVIGEGLREARFSMDDLRGSPHGRVVIVDADGKRAWSNPVWA